MPPDASSPAVTPPSAGEELRRTEEEATFPETLTRKDPSPEPLAPPKGKKAEVNPALCKGDGLCCSKCPTDAIYLKHFTNEEVFLQIDAALSEDDWVPAHKLAARCDSPEEIDPPSEKKSA